MEFTDQLCCRTENVPCLAFLDEKNPEKKGKKRLAHLLIGVTLNCFFIHFEAGIANAIPSVKLIEK